MIREFLTTFASVTVLLAALGLSVALLALAHDLLEQWWNS